MKHSFSLRECLAVPLVLLPILTAIFLFESYVGVLQASAADDARRILRPAAQVMTALSRPEEALSQALDRAFPEGFPDINPGTADLVRKRTIEGVQRRLGIRSPGFRQYLFDANVGSLDPGPDAASLTIIHFGAQAMEKSRKEDWISKTEPVLRQRFGAFASLEDYVSTSRFNWAIPRPDGHRTFVGRRRSTWGNTAIHLEVDDTSLDRDLLLRNCLQNPPPEIDLAAICDEDGQTIASFTKSPDAFPQGFPLPALEGEILESEDGFFLRSPIPGFRQASLVIGLAPPFPGGIPKIWRHAAEFWSALSLVSLGWFLLRRIEAKEGERSSLVWRVVGLFGFASLVPVFVLTYFGFLSLLQARTVEEATWESRMISGLRQADGEFRHRMARNEEAMRRVRQGVAHAMARGIPVLEVLSSSPTRQQHLVDRAGYLYSSAFGKEKRRSPDSLPPQDRFYHGILKLFLDSILQEKEGPGESPRESPSLLDMAFMAVLGEDNPVFQIIRQPDTFRELGFAGQFVSLCVTLVPSPQGLPVAALMLIYDIPFISGQTLEAWARNPCAWPGGSFFNYIEHLNLYLPRCMGAMSGVPELTRQVSQTGLAESRIVKDAFGDFLCLLLPGVNFNQALLGATIETGYLDEAGRKRTREIIALAVGILGTFLLVIIQFRRRVLRPLRELHRGAVAIGEGQFEMRLPGESGDELGELAETFNRMAEGLQQRERMRRFVSSGAWEAVDGGRQDHEGGRRYDAAILFSDIRGFTTISESSSPEVVISLLNEYFTAMDRIIRRNGGMIDKLIGDAILAVFKPIPGVPDPARRAVIAGLGLRAALSHFNRRRARLGLFPIDNGVGIHYGQVIEGSIGSQTGRKDLTVIGRTVSRAMHLEGASKRGISSRVIVSPELASRLGGEYPLLPLRDSDPPLFELDRPWDLQGSEARPPGAAS